MICLQKCNKSTAASDLWLFGVDAVINRLVLLRRLSKAQNETALSPIPGVGKLFEQRAALQKIMKPRAALIGRAKKNGSSRLQMS